QPWFISARDHQPVLMAGFTAWQPGREILAETGFAIVTDDAAGGIIDIHDRRPICLSAEDAISWLDPATPITTALELLSTPRPESAFQWWPVTPRMGNPRYQLPDTADPVRDLPQPVRDLPPTLPGFYLNADIPRPRHAQLFDSLSRRRYRRGHASLREYVRAETFGNRLPFWNFGRQHIGLLAHGGTFWAVLHNLGAYARWHAAIFSHRCSGRVHHIFRLLARCRPAL